MSRRENPNGNRRIAWQNVLTVFSAAILIVPEVVGAALSRRSPGASTDERDEKKSCQVGRHRLCAQLPNFARACGRVSVGGHPDKRPDSRPEQDRRLSTAIA